MNNQRIIICFSVIIIILVLLCFASFSEKDFHIKIHSNDVPVQIYAVFPGEWDRVCYFKAADSYVDGKNHAFISSKAYIGSYRIKSKNFIIYSENDSFFVFHTNEGFDWIKVPHSYIDEVIIESSMIGPAPCLSRQDAILTRKIGAEGMFFASKRDK